MEFQKLLTLFDGSDPDLNAELYGEIQTLLKLKAVTDEKQMNPQMEPIISFIRSHHRIAKLSHPDVVVPEECRVHQK